MCETSERLGVSLWPPSAFPHREAGQTLDVTELLHGSGGDKVTMSQWFPLGKQATGRVKGEGAAMSATSMDAKSR